MVKVSVVIADQFLPPIVVSRDIQPPKQYKLHDCTMTTHDESAVSLYTVVQVLEGNLSVETNAFPIGFQYLKTSSFPTSSTHQFPILQIRICGIH